MTRSPKLAVPFCVGCALLLALSVRGSAAGAPDGRRFRNAELERSFRHGIEWGRASLQPELDHCTERLSEADRIIFGPIAEDHERAARYARCLLDIRAAEYGNQGALQAVISRCTAEFP